VKYAARRDANHSELVAAFKKLGCFVVDLSANGKGVPDLLVRLRGGPPLHAHFVELKTPKGKPNALQERFYEDWPVSIVRDLAGVETVVRMLRGESR
jgi:hypothetical protein